MSAMTDVEANAIVSQLKGEVDSLVNMAVLPMNSRVVLRVPLGVPTTQATPLDEPYVVASASYTTDKAVRTYIKAIEYAYIINGTYGTGDEAFNASINLSPTQIANAIELVCMLKDSGSDREFSNTWLPLPVFASGWIQGHRFGRGHAFLSPGAEVTASLGVTFFNPDALDAITITSIDVVLSLVGFTVPAE